MDHILAVTNHTHVCVYTHLDSKQSKHCQMHAYTQTQSSRGRIRMPCSQPSPVKETEQCVRDGLSNTKANPVPGSPDLLYHLHSLHFTGQLFSLILFLLFTHATVWKEAALYRARVTERDGFPRAWGDATVQVIKNHNTSWSDKNSSFQCPSNEKRGGHLWRQSVHSR